jgi:hypothetical protein
MEGVVTAVPDSSTVVNGVEKSNGGGNGEVLVVAPIPVPGGVFIKKSAAKLPAGVPLSSAISPLPSPGAVGGAGGAKMTASVSFEIPSGFKVIDRNIYVCRSEVKLRTHELPRCHCKEGRCGPNECENAMVFMECSSDRCPLGKTCQNQRFQKRQYAGIIPKRCGAKGWGIFSQLPISAGQFVMEYVGEVIDANELDIRSKACANEPHYYFLSLTGGETIDASKKGNISRFINHSCDPNCITQKWQVNGESRVGIFALRNIKVGEELTFDYQFERFSHKKQRCLCGAANCSKYLGSKPKPKDGEKKRVKKQEDDVIRYTEVAEAILPDEHVALLLDDQNIDTFPFMPIDEKWYFLPKEKIPLESDTEEEEEESSSSSSDSSDEQHSDSESETKTERRDGESPPPSKSRKLVEGENPHNGNGLIDDPSSKTKTTLKKDTKDSDSSDSESEHPQHPAREFVNKVEGRAPLFRRSHAHRERLRLLDAYSDMLYDKIDQHKEKKTLMQDAELKAMSTLVGVDSSQSWMASLDLKQLIKDGLLEFDRSDTDRGRMRRASTRSAKK